eukprot:TRINITY_DN72083_c0_g1_i1.p1 TRINITY_DN72083_c0_g1~~TRINITY_DN72083_c0_g1_i1.p1  ORF type:complete len:349 (-),score=40.42 TRINITY_DN72083_c0_g1_i1:83-1042(-)
MKKKISDYIISDLISTCSDGEIYKAVNALFPDPFFAIRMVPKNSLPSEKLLALEKEITALQETTHENIIRLKDLKASENNYYLVFEYCNGGNLAELVMASKDGHLSENVTRAIIRQIVAGLDVLHAKGIVHNNIKANNILLNYPNEEAVEKAYPVAKIADFRQVRFVHTDSNQEYHGDILQLGELLYELICGKEVTEVYHIPKELGLSVECLDFMNACLQINPDKSFPIKTAKNHPFISEDSYNQIKEENVKVEGDDYVFSRKERNELLARSIADYFVDLGGEKEGEDEYEKVDSLEKSEEDEYTAVAKEVPKVDEGYF